MTTYIWTISAELSCLKLSRSSRSRVDSILNHARGIVGKLLYIGLSILNDAGSVVRELLKRAIGLVQGVLECARSLVNGILDGALGLLKEVLYGVHFEMCLLNCDGAIRLSLDKGKQERVALGLTSLLWEG